MYQPVFSIVTIVYNGASLLDGTIQSVLNQTYPGIEYIIVDGGSKDGTLELIEQYASKISKWVSEKDKGIYDAMTKGLHMASGDYIWYLNCGDHFHAVDTVEKVAALCGPETDAMYGDVFMVDDDRRVLGKMSEITPHKYPEQLVWSDLKYGMNVCHQSFIARRTIAPDYIENNLAADIDWVIRCLKKSRETVNTKLVLSEYLIGGISKQLHRQSMIDRFWVLSRHFGFVYNCWNHLMIVLRAFLFKWKKKGDFSY